MKFTWVMLYLLYMMAILVTPLQPSIYNVFIDTLEFSITETFCLLLYKYHNSIPMSHKTVLNFLMKVLTVCYGFIFLSHWFTSIFFNLMTTWSLGMLESYPSAVCFILDADFPHWLFLINIILIIMLHACFTAYPSTFLNWNENVLKIVIYIFNLVCLVLFALEKWTESFCGKILNSQLTKKLKLEVDIVLYKGKG